MAVMKLYKRLVITTLNPIGAKDRVLQSSDRANTGYATFPNDTIFVMTTSPSNSADATNGSLGSDGLILACLLSGSILILSVLSNADPLPTLGVVIAALLILSLYLRRRDSQTVPARPKLSESEVKQLRAAILAEVADALPVAAVALNPDSEVLHANARAQDLLSPDIVNRPIGSYLRSSELRPCLEAAFKGQSVDPLSVHMLEPTERFLDVAFSQPMSFSPNTARKDIVFAVLSDRTQATTDREKRADFLANASHELKTPIASIKGYIETLRGHAKDDPEAQEKFLGIMQEQSERMERLITDLLSLRKIESSEHIAPTQTANLRDALNTARDVVKPLAEKRDIILHLNLINQQDPVIFGKTDECVQLFVNLVENAVKLSPQGSRVAVTLDYLTEWTGDAFPPPLRPGGQLRRIVNLVPAPLPAWRVIITDQGPGFSRTHLPRIGERFYRVAGDLPAQEKGTGLGLAIVKHVVLRHRAGLFVHTMRAADSALESGTSFSVIFMAPDSSTPNSST